MTLKFKDKSILTPAGLKLFNDISDAGGDTSDFIYSILLPQDDEILKTLNYVDQEFSSNRKSIKILQSDDFMNELLDSIETYGFDTSKNKILLFALNSNDVFNVLNKENFKLINNFINNDKIPVDKDWLYDTRAYDTIYKLKALAFLSSNRAKNYGDNPEKLIDDILSKTGANDDVIKRLLSEWQTKDEDHKQIVLDILKLLDNNGRYNNLRANDKDNASLILIKDAINKLLRKFYKSDLVDSLNTLIDNLCQNKDPFNAIRELMLREKVYELSNENETMNYAADKVYNVINKLKQQDNTTALNDLNSRELRLRNADLTNRENTVKGYEVIAKALNDTADNLNTGKIMSWVNALANKITAPDNGGVVNYVKTNNTSFNNLERDTAFRADLTDILQKDYKQITRDDTVTKLLAGQIVKLLIQYNYIRKA